MTTALVVATVAAATFCYVMLFGFLLRPQLSVYAFVVLWVLLPNGGANYFNIGGLPVHRFITPVLACGVLAALLRRGGFLPTREESPVGRRMVQVFLIALLLSLIGLALQYAVGWNRISLGGRVSLLVNLQSPVWLVMTMEALERVGLVVLFAGLLRFVRTPGRVEILYLIVLLLAGEVLMEAVLLGIAGTPEALVPLAHHTEGRFNSLVLNDFVAVSMLGGAGIAVCFYFALRGYRWVMVPLAVALMIPVVLGGQRSPLLAVLVMIVFLLYQVSSASVRVRRLGAAVAVTLAIVASQTVPLPGLEAAREAYQEIRSGRTVFGTESLFARMGLQLRTVDVMVAKAPFGVGPGMLPFYMADPSVPTRFFPGTGADANLLVSYDQAVSGEKVTRAHNYFVETVAELGIAGLAWIGALFWGIHRAWRAQREGRTRARRRLTPEQRRVRLLWDAAWGGLIAVAVTVLFVSRPDFYVLYLVFIRAVLLPLPRSASSVPTSRTPRTPSLGAPIAGAPAAFRRGALATEAS